MTPKEKFQNYFNLKKDFYVEDDQISGWATHEGQEIRFIAYLHLDEVFDFDGTQNKEQLKGKKY